MRLLIEVAYVSIKTFGKVESRLTSNITKVLPNALNLRDARLVIETIPVTEPLLFKVLKTAVVSSTTVCSVSYIVRLAFAQRTPRALSCCVAQDSTNADLLSSPGPRSRCGPFKKDDGSSVSSARTLIVAIQSH